VAKALVNGLVAGNKTALGKLFPTEADLKANFDCTPEGLSKALGEIAEGKEDVMKNADDRPPAGMKVSFAGFDLENEEVAPVGTDMDGCSNKTEMGVISGKLKIKITQDGDSNEDDEGILLLRLDKKYFLLEM